MSEPKWFDRKFEFTFPLELLPNLKVRLRGTPARLEEILRGRPVATLIDKPDDKWSAQEHAGHLLDSRRSGSRALTTSLPAGTSSHPPTLRTGRPTMPTTTRVPWTKSSPTFGVPAKRSCGGSTSWTPPYSPARSRIPA